jgi:hypothetical protein
MEAGLDQNLRTLQEITRPRLFPDYEWHSDGHMRHVSPLESEIEAQEAKAAKSNKRTPPTTASSSTTTVTKRSTTSVYLINKTREIHQRFQGSAYYVLPTFEADVARYSTQRQEKDNNTTPTTNANFEDANCMHVIHQMGKTADPRYVPPELLKLSDPASLYDTNDDGLLSSSSKKRPVDPLKEAENEERKSSKGGGDDAGAAVADPAASGTTAPAAGTTNNNEDDDNFSDFQDADEDEEEDADYATNYYASEDESDGGGDEAVF